MDLHSRARATSAATLRPVARPGFLRALVAALLIPIVTASTPLDVTANEVTAGGSAPGLVIHGAAETLHEYCRADSEGTLWLELPSGARFELITSTTDPAISNPGDGMFHPFDEAEVRAALASLRFPIDAVRADVYLLPYPRRAGLESAAGPGLMLLSPGVRALSAEIQHSQVVHELGHVVQYHLMPDQDARWQTYRRLRGIEDPTTYSSSSAHANRPHEIFAEDFRFLFGGSQANYSGTIENPALRSPRDVPGLDRFMLELGGSTPVTTMRAWPLPARGAVTFASPGAPLATLELFDAAGRRVARVEPRFGTAGVEWSWNGRDDFGRNVPAGILIARVRGDAGRVAIVPVAP